MNVGSIVAPAISSADRTDRDERLAWISPDHAPFAGKYTVERILGQGGMGIVFEARHIRLGQRVAIKVLGSELREYPELVQRFEREARACGSLTSSHAVRVFDIDATEDGTPYIVMELLTGRDLACVVERDGPQAIACSVRWLIQACDAIAEAHSLGIVHRDIKPSNLFLAHVDGRPLVKVLDFGIAKRVSTQEVAITHAVAPLGTPQYMSPEQVRCAKDVDARTDVWSLGVTLYELVTGRTPFQHESSSACIASIAADPVPDPRTHRPELPDAFVDVLLKALAKSAKDRFQSVEELVVALAPFAAGDDDDDAMVSALRRAFEAAASGAPAREAHASGSDRTVPPAVSRVSLPPSRRVAPKLAMVSAVMLGLAALVLTPKCVATPTEGSANAAVPAANDDVVAPPVPAVVAPEVLVAPAPVAAPVPVVAAPVVSGAPPPPPPPHPHVHDARPAAPRPAVAAPPARAARKVDRPSAAEPRSDVHGGLSSPGF